MTGLYDYIAGTKTPQNIAKKRQDKVITILFLRTVNKTKMRGLKDIEY